ncbi:MAG: F0F1 ATP synthase subunit delta [Candidatus Yonathbacteria bacterium]|nr:F0F1 ATP synthase subunit delta [Candidatus Yonathbacteria bacterium]
MVRWQNSMKASWYAEALYGALQGKHVKSESDSEKVFTRFRKVLSLRGHDRLLPFISHEFEKILSREKDKNEVTLVTADSKSVSKWAHAYDYYEKQGIISKHATRLDVVDETIVGGFQIRTKDTLIDGSYKTSLVNLYRQITN